MPESDRLHVVMLASEVFPFAKTGGLADMVSSLAVSLERLGQHVTVLMPAYQCALRSREPIEETEIRFVVPVSAHDVEATLLRARLGSDISVYLIRADQYFDRENLYGTRERDYCDNAERFVFFCRASLEALHRIEPAHILHAHDWQTALAVAFMKAQPEKYGQLSTLKTVFTIHNLGYQGLFESDNWHLLNLDERFFTQPYLEFYRRINFLKGGLVSADAITTVSPTYSKEIRIAENGFGLDGVLRERAPVLTGILNGADYSVWNPATDPAIASNYDSEDRSGKRHCKAELQWLSGLPEDPKTPLIGVVSRLASQKGFDLIENVFEKLLGRNLQFVLLGAGDSHYEDFFRIASDRHRGKAVARIAHDEGLAHKIEAGADMFLMPSRYEPCGLNQLYSLKYGTIPIVRATGGLKDTVADFEPATGEGTGFVFEDYDGTALLAAVDRAVAAYHRKDQWERVMDNAMSADYSWGRSAGEYLSLYQSLLDCRHSTPQ